MNLAEEIYRQSMNLPPDAAREALDFIEFLVSRRSRVREESWDAIVERFAGSLGDDFPDDIDESGLGEDAPRDALE